MGLAVRTHLRWDKRPRSVTHMQTDSDSRNAGGGSKRPCRQFVGDVILVDVAHVVDRLPPHPLSGYSFHVAEPDVGIETATPRFCAEAGNARWAAVVCGER